MSEGEQADRLGPLSPTPFKSARKPGRRSLDPRDEEEDDKASVFSTLSELDSKVRGLPSSVGAVPTSCKHSCEGALGPFAGQCGCLP